MAQGPATVTFTAYDNKQYTLTNLHCIYATETNAYNTVYVASVLHGSNVSGRYSVTPGNYTGAISIENGNNFTLLKACIIINQVGSDRWLEFLFPPILKNTSYTTEYLTCVTSAPSPKDLNEVAKLLAPFHQGTNIIVLDDSEIAEYVCSKVLTYNNIPVYVDKTKINFTDGTYMIKDGALDSSNARSEGYKQLLNTYGTFYKATERELSESFANNLTSNE